MFASSSSNSFLTPSLQFVPKITTNTTSLSPACVRVRQPRPFAAYATSVCADMAASPTSLYEVLGIPTSATGHEIKAAYRKLARTCHPDVAAVNRRDTSAKEFIKIHAAYSTLSDPDKRAVYDRDLFMLRHRFSSLSAAAAAAVSMTSPAGYSGYPRGNWETDQCW
ncbi:Chaperone protein dnaJ 11 like [Actinidia chinensis var. chinensis]|uniref:Chaperone protein dnaJ 11 like n=1 Tax=Actinidia chinensis var. chinensis TaxID=1590841 RepID=A0A2R6RHN2_ACTCC|nr:Chaperone protein dnaJ 11 like [Actinidia chinensis var. chinensis]